jgi:hypothetical protein
MREFLFAALVFLAMVCFMAGAGCNSDQRPAASVSSHTVSNVARTESGNEIQGLNRQSVKMDGYTAAHPGEGRTIHGLNGLNVRGNGE